MAGLSEKKKTEKNKKDQISINEEEWLQLKLLEEFLEPFYEATNVLSATDFPTSNHRDLILFELKEHLESQINNELL